MTRTSILAAVAIALGLMSSQAWAGTNDSAGWTTQLKWVGGARHRQVVHTRVAPPAAVAASPALGYHRAAHTYPGSRR